MEEVWNRETGCGDLSSHSSTPHEQVCKINKKLALARYSFQLDRTEEGARERENQREPHFIPTYTLSNPKGVGNELNKPPHADEQKRERDFVISLANHYYTDFLAL